MAVRRTALVTGATYGVGAATALALARDGFDLAITATTIEHLAATMQALAGTAARVVPVALDLRDQPSLPARTGEIVAALGGLDLLVNNAGANLRKDAVDVTAAEWDALMDVNLRGTFFLTQQVGRAMISAGRGGCIINIASTYALVGAPERSVYGISKAALVGMTRMLAVEWAASKIRVNAIAPGPAGDAITVARRQGSGSSLYGSNAQAHSAAPAGKRRGVAATVAYLASDAAASMTGQLMVLDGGLTVA